MYFDDFANFLTLRGPLICSYDVHKSSPTPKMAKKRGEDDGSNNLVQDMPLAKAILDNNTSAVGSIIAKCLPNPESVTVDVDKIEKSLGEAFTGGRSTPVYNVTCLVSRPDGKRRERHFVIKLVLMPSSSSSSSDSIWVKRESYAVERRWYDSSAAQQVRNQQLPIPKFLYSDHNGSRPWPAVCFLMNDVRQMGFCNHPDFLNTNQIKCALKWIASFHALFWGDQNQKRDLWDHGGFWTPKNQDATNPTVETSGLAQQWTQTVRWFEMKHPSLINSHIRGLGKRLETAAGPIGEVLTLQSSKIGTIIHGDLKAANLFFANVHEDDGPESVAVLDFQFTGWGLGAEDVACLLFPDARGHYFDNEEELLQCYHHELISQLMLQQKGGPSTLTFERFRGLYELSRCDLFRYLLRKGWVASNDGDVKLVQALEATLLSIDGGQVLSNHNDYMKAFESFLGV